MILRDSVAVVFLMLTLIPIRFSQCSLVVVVVQVLAASHLEKREEKIYSKPLVLKVQDPEEVIWEVWEVWAAVEPEE